MPNRVYALIQRVCHPKFTAKRNGWEFTRCGTDPCLHQAPCNSCESKGQGAQWETAGAAGEEMSVGEEMGQ